jgi:Ca2+-binding EF-hand superfamily protein
MGEIELHKASEDLKQKLESSMDFTEDALYTTVDDWGYGFVDQRNLKSFFRNNKYKATDQDCVAIIRRLDLDGQSKLTKDEFLMGLTP